MERPEATSGTIGVMVERLPQSVTEFLEIHIDSVEQLQVLLLLRLDPERAWTTAEIARQVGTSVPTVELRLGRLTRHGLVEQGDGSYAYTLTGAGDRQVGEVAAYFKSRRSAVIATIFAGDGGGD